jgi:hypothetical protein
MGISAMIPDLNIEFAVIYVAGLTDQNKVKVLKYYDHLNEWDMIAELDH